MMNTKQRTDISRYGAGACFVLLAIFQLADLAMYGFTFLRLLRTIAYLVMAASFFAQIPTLGTVGSGLYILIAVISFIPNIRLDNTKGILLFVLLPIAAYVIFLIMTLKRGNAKQLGYAAATVVVVRRFLLLFYIPSIGISFSDLLLAAGFLLAGFAYANVTLKPPKTAANTQQNTVVDSIQRLENLQRLLEQGIITQEEFDTKKSICFDCKIEGRVSRLAPCLFIVPKEKGIYKP